MLLAMIASRIVPSIITTTARRCVVVVLPPPGARALTISKPLTTTARRCVVAVVLPPPAVRSLTTSKSKPPGTDPLDILKKECMARNLCDKEGGRLPGAHWVFVTSIANDSGPSKPPNLRTVGIERCSSAGIDFVMKRSHPAAEVLERGEKPISFLHVQGKFLPGENAEQWRGEGLCRPLPLPEVMDLIPHFTITSMVGSTRLANEQEDAELAELKKEVSEDRLLMLNKSHMTEIMQTTRIELENGDISMEELDQSIRAYRLIPDRVESMLGGPDTIMWDRWEWLRDTSVDNSEGGPIAWNDPKHLVPH